MRRKRAQQHHHITPDGADVWLAISRYIALDFFLMAPRVVDIPRRRRRQARFVAERTGRRHVPPPVPHGQPPCRLLPSRAAVVTFVARRPTRQSPSLRAMFLHSNSTIFRAHARADVKISSPAIHAHDVMRREDGLMPLLPCWRGLPLFCRARCFFHEAVCSHALMLIYCRRYAIALPRCKRV